VGVTASGTVVSGTGAELLIVSGATASGATLSAGGFDAVKSGGIAVSTTIGSGGIEDDQGTARSALVASGGVEIVDSGGTASGTTVMSGGVDVVVSGGTASATTLSGGFMEVRSGAAVGSGTAVTFASGGVLQLDDSVHFGGMVAGFGVPSLLDLRDIAFTSATTVNFVEAPSNTSGTLTVTDGTPATTANITLIGQYMASQFHIRNDGAGDTQVSDPPTSSSNPTQLALANTQH
jgi:autotransporter passenger strand-loop-strand repeat protein